MPVLAFSFPQPCPQPVPVLSTLPLTGPGLDMEMPDNQYFGPALATAIQQGLVNLSRLDDMVTRIFTSAYAVGIMVPVSTSLPLDFRSLLHFVAFALTTLPCLR